ncbi:heat shock protein 70 family [Terfezia claveryi]|nr:heat shock protein 70 family [Terfezia claveryi]
MSVVGIDFGNLNTVIAVARNRGVDVITNEVSNRATPSLVGFGPKSRYIGEAAKTQEISNLKNTVGSLKRLAGRQYDDPELEIEKQFITCELTDVQGQAGARVSYVGRKEDFAFTQIIAMYLTKIKQIASAELKIPVSDVVISVPAWFTDPQRRALMDAAEFAGLKLLRLMNDTTATALGYGITKTDLPLAEEKPRRVAFVDIGHSNYTCSIVAFKKGELQVLSTAYDRHFGGRNFDKILVDHFATEFKERYKIDIHSNPKAYLRVATGVEKMKKVLSANAVAPLNIESVMNDVDVQTMLKREDFEELCKPLLDRATFPLEQALADAKLSIEDIDIVEVVGGCSRIPALKEKISTFFNKPLSFTLNQDEAVARGCTWACAILSPAFRVKDFSVHDIVPYPIEFTWEKSQEIPDEDTNLTVFPKGNAVPSTKILTFYRKENFDLEARYAEPESLPGKISPWIGKFSIKNVHPDPKDDFMICKLKARVNLHGVLNVESGYYVEEIEVEEEIKDEENNDVSSISIGTVSEALDGVPRRPKRRSSSSNETESPSHTPSPTKGPKSEEPPTLTSEPQAMDVDQQAVEARPRTRKVRKQVKKGDLPVVAVTSSLDQVTKDIYTEKENQMAMEDKLVADTEDRKNALEEYIYDLRNKTDDIWAPFATEPEKQRIKEMCDAAEEWLYGEGEDSTKAAYIQKYEELRSIAGIIAQRYFDHEEEKRQKNRANEEAEASKRAAEMRKNHEPNPTPGVEDVDNMVD